MTVMILMTPIRLFRAKVRWWCKRPHNFSIIVAGDKWCTVYECSRCGFRKTQDTPLARSIDEREDQYGNGH